MSELYYEEGKGWIYKNAKPLPLWMTSCKSADGVLFNVVLYTEDPRDNLRYFIGNSSDMDDWVRWIRSINALQILNHHATHSFKVWVLITLA